MQGCGHLWGCVCLLTISCTKTPPRPCWSQKVVTFAHSHVRHVAHTSRHVRAEELSCVTSGAVLRSGVLRSPFRLMSIFITARDTDSVVICCCKRAKGGPREKICARICADACMWISECQCVSARISITQHCNQQPSSCDSATSHSLSLVCILHTRSRV